MKNTDQEKILTFLNSNPEAEIDAICIGTKLSYLTVKGELKTLVTEEKIKEGSKKGVANYTITEKGKQVAPKTEQPKKEVTVEKAAVKAAPKPVTKTEVKPADKSDIKQTPKRKEDEDLGEKTYTGRDSTRYRFGEHRQLSKGRCALLLVRAFAEKNPKVSLSKLQEIFHSVELFPRFQLVEEIGKAKKFSQGNRHRFFLAPDDIFVVGPDKKKCAVCSQFTKDIMDRFLKIAAASPIGLKVKEEAAE